MDAYDLDEGPNGQIIFNLSEHTHKDFGKIFEILEKNLVLVGHLNYETTKKYSLSVTAQDLGHEPMTSFASVLVNVEDVNDNPPKIKLNALTPNMPNHTNHLNPPKSSFSYGVKHETPLEFFIFENHPSVQNVVHLSVTDIDSGNNAETNCQLLDFFSMFTLQQLYTNEFQVVTIPGVIFDRELSSHYNLPITCNDHGLPIPLTSSIQIRINVADDNDNPPVFSQHHYHFKVHENRRIGTRVATISASDRDEGDNGRVSYFMVNTQARRFFDVDSNSGSIILKGGVDREKKDEFKFVVKCKDHGNPPKTSSANVTIQVC